MMTSSKKADMKIFFIPSRFSWVGPCPSKVSRLYPLISCLWLLTSFSFQQDDDEMRKHANEFSIFVLPVCYTQNKSVALSAGMLFWEGIIYAHGFEKNRLLLSFTRKLDCIWYVYSFMQLENASWANKVKKWSELGRMLQPSGAAVAFVWRNRYSETFLKIHRKTPVQESLF